VAEKVVVQLVLDTSRYTKGASTAARDTAKIRTATDKTSKSVSGLGSTALKAGAALGAAFAAKAALDFAKSSIAAFSNLDESINAVEVSFGEAADGVLKLGENSAEQFGLSTTAVNEAAVAMSRRRFRKRAATRHRLRIGNEHRSRRIPSAIPVRVSRRI